jgi:glycosyl hydrolase family 26
VILGTGDHVRRHALGCAGRLQPNEGSRLGRVLLLLCAVAGACAPASPASAAGTGSRTVSATPAPIGVFPGGIADRSIVTFEQTLGRSLDYAHDYINKGSWGSMATTSSWMAQRWRAAGFAGRTVFTLPMLPDRGGSMRAGARGRYNQRFRQIARRLVAGGQGSSVVRIGPEFNGTWFRWTIHGKGNSTRYKAYWRQIVRTMRSVEGAHFRFDWSPNGGSSWVNGGKRRLRAATAYPGDAYVDYIGLDVYDQSWATHSASPTKRWQEFLTQTDGLNWHARFAAAHGKPMTFPEWGLVKRSDGRGGGDNPYFIEQMHNWIQTHPVAYHLYFESHDPNGDYRVFGGTFPNAAQTFVRRFGAVGT